MTTNPNQYPPPQHRKEAGPGRNRIDEILSTIDGALGDPHQRSPEATLYGDVAPNMPPDDVCWRCTTNPVTADTSTCEGCRAYLLGDTDVDPAARNEPWGADLVRALGLPGGVQVLPTPELGTRVDAMVRRAVAEQVADEMARRLEQPVVARMVDPEQPEAGLPDELAPDTSYYLMNMTIGTDGRVTLVPVTEAHGPDVSEEQRSPEFAARVAQELSGVMGVTLVAAPGAAERAERLAGMSVMERYCLRVAEMMDRREMARARHRRNGVVVRRLREPATLAAEQALLDVIRGATPIPRDNPVEAGASMAYLDALGTAATAAGFRSNNWASRAAATYLRHQLAQVAQMAAANGFAGLMAQSLSDTVAPMGSPYGVPLPVYQRP